MHGGGARLGKFDCFDQYCGFEVRIFFEKCTDMVFLIHWRGVNGTAFARAGYNRGHFLAGRSPSKRTWRTCPMAGLSEISIAGMVFAAGGSVPLACATTAPSDPCSRAARRHGRHDAGRDDEPT